MLLTQSVCSELLGAKARSLELPKNETTLFEICMDFLLKQWRNDQAIATCHNHKDL